MTVKLVEYEVLRKNKRIGNTDENEQQFTETACFTIMVERRQIGETSI